MKKIIPFKKDIIFKTNLSEITSISLEHTLERGDNNEINGNFIVSGDYKIADTSVNVEPFSYDLPFRISMDDKYILDNVKIDIDDFYYEIINSNVLSVNIEVLIDKLEEKIILNPEEEVNDIEKVDIKKEELPLEEELIEVSKDNLELEEMMEDRKEELEVHDVSVENTKERCIEKEDGMGEISSLFENMSEVTETYKSYKIYIVREGDNLDSILEKYSVTKEVLEEYNDLKEIKIGDKIIIPS